MRPPTLLVATVALLIGGAVSWGGGGVAGAQVAAPDPYLLGRERLEEGDLDGALDIWYQAWDSLSAEGGVHDPRLALAYVETSVRRGRAGEYAAASRVHAWGFSGRVLEPYLDEVRAEAARIAPLMEPADSADLVALAAAADPEILRRIRLFWLQKDPSPDTELNERLIEHWERIVYARENFTRSRLSPYRSDDRGTIYVKYGAPDKKTSGSMGARDDELRFWVPDRTAREELRRYDYGPQFEVWAYDGLNPREIVYFLFGNEKGRGPFRLLESPNDLIPDEAWSVASRGRGMGASASGVKAGYFLQFFYYAELAMIGGPYSARFGELELLWGTWESRGFSRGTSTVPREGDLDALDQRYVQEDRYARTDRPTTPDFSEFDDGTRAVDLVVEPVRTLSPDDEPQLYIVSLSGPRVSVEPSGGRVRRRDVVNADLDYRATHTLVVRDEEFLEVGRIEDTVTPREGDMAVFVLRHVPQRLHYTVVVEVERDAEQAADETSHLPGRAHFEVGEPLPTDTSALVMSDVVTGVAPTADESYEGLPFPVVPSRTIWREDPIRLYVELYHLALDAVGVARYRYDFSIAPAPELAALAPDARPVTLSMDLEFRAPTARDVFDIEVSALPLGPSVVSVRATDLLTGRTVERSVDVQLVR